jgi:hypothetical protein
MRDAVTAPHIDLGRSRSASPPTGRRARHRAGEELLRELYQLISLGIQLVG